MAMSLSVLERSHFDFFSCVAKVCLSEVYQMDIDFNQSNIVVCDVENQFGETSFDLNVRLEDNFDYFLQFDNPIEIGVAQDQQQNEAESGVVDNQQQNEPETPIETGVADIQQAGEPDEHPDYDDVGFSEVVPPEIGMEFDSTDDAYKFYKDYGLRLGFGVVKRSKHSRNGIYYHHAYACNKQKKAETRDSNMPPLAERNHPVLGTKCKAMMKISNNGALNRWVVCKLNLEHNHELTPDTSYLITIYREIPPRFKIEMEVNDDDGMPAWLNITTVIKHAGGYGKATFTRKDARNYLDKYRREKAKQLPGNDASVLMDYFDKKKLRDPNFFFSSDIDKNGRLINVFWTDGRGRATYRYFHDVIVLDSTYLTNRYDMPLVLFVGVNHHGHSMILACALIAKEDNETYKWVFKKFLQCMKNVKPGAILIDQCARIAHGIEKVLPGVLHRFCAWHITHKFTGHWGGTQDKEELTKMVKKVVYTSLTPQEFEDRWDKVMREIGYTILYRRANLLIEDCSEFGSVDEQAAEFFIDGLITLRIRLSGFENSDVGSNENAESSTVQNSGLGRGRGRGACRGGRGRGAAGGGTGRGADNTIGTENINEVGVDRENGSGRGRGAGRGERGRGTGRGRGRGAGRGGGGRGIVIVEAENSLSEVTEMNNDGPDQIQVNIPQVSEAINVGSSSMLSRQEFVNSRPNGELQPPEKSRTKGRPRSGRIKATVDKFIESFKSQILQRIANAEGN